MLCDPESEDKVVGCSEEGWAEDWRMKKVAPVSKRTEIDASRNLRETH